MLRASGAGARPPAVDARQPVAELSVAPLRRALDPRETRALHGAPEVPPGELVDHAGGDRDEQDEAEDAEQQGADDAPDATTGLRHERSPA